MKSLNAEINNGRLAMMAIIGILTCGSSEGRGKPCVTKFGRCVINSGLLSRIWMLMNVDCAQKVQ